MRIAIDIDDTITKTYENNVNVLRNNNYKEKDKYDFTPEDFQRFMDRHFDEIHSTMEPYDNAPEVINRIGKHNKIIILSSRDDYELDRTREFFNKHNIKYDQMYLGVTDKGEVAKELNIDYIVDDCEKYLDSCSQYGIKCIKFGKKSHKYKSVKNWLELEKYIEEIA